MQKIVDELTSNFIMAAQRSRVPQTSSSNFSDFLDTKEKDSDNTPNKNNQAIDIHMQSLQNKAQLNKMVISSIA